MYFVRYINKKKLACTVHSKQRTGLVLRRIPSILG